MDESQARELFAGDRAEALVEVIEGGWADMTEDGTPWRKTTRANVVHDHTVRRADAVLLGFDGVRRIERHRIPMYVFDDRAVVRFKKHDGGLLTRNVLTRHQRDLAVQGVFPGIPSAAVHLCAGYRLDEAEADISDVVLTKSVTRTKNDWVIDLRELAAGEMTPLASPLFPDQPTPALPKVGSPAEKKKTDGGPEAP
jgi:hypothetical protein